MPTFYQDVEVEVDLDVNDFISCCSREEIDELIYTLKKEGYLINNIIKSEDSILETEFNNTINKIQSNRLRLTNEEDEILRKIASRF